MEQGPDIIFDLATGFWHSATMFAACELGLFDLLEAEPQTAESAAQKLGASDRGVAGLLTGCASNKDHLGAEDFLTERETKAALAKTKSPQYFGFHAYPAEGGIGFMGEVRLHPNHQAQLDMIDGQPVVKLRGKAKRQKGQALMDISSATTWIEFSKAEEFGAIFMGMNEDVIPYRGGFTGEVDGYAAVVRQMRFDMLFMENVPLYVRMSRGALGPIARNIYDPHVDVAFGWDVLGQFETIQVSLRDGVIILSSSHPYSPHEDLLMSTAKIRKVQGYGLTVAGGIYGVDTPVVLDLAGDFHFMRADKKVAQTKQVSLGELVYRQVPTQFLSIPGALPRAGRKMLEPYLMTICPRQGVVYFERYPDK